RAPRWSCWRRRYAERGMMAGREGAMTRRGLTLLVLTTAILTAAVVGAAEIKPHMWGWEQIFSLEYGPGQYKGKPAIEGTVTNISPYDLANVRILVDRLDAGGQITGQQVAWLPGELCGGGLTVLNYMNGNQARRPEWLPRIPGHELVGTVVEQGPGVENPRIGERVMAYFYLACGHCDLCRLAHEPLCRNLKGNVGVAA